MERISNKELVSRVVEIGEGYVGDNRVIRNLLGIDYEFSEGEWEFECEFLSSLEGYLDSLYGIMRECAERGIVEGLLGLVRGRLGISNVDDGISGYCYGVRTLGDVRKEVGIVD